MDNRRFDGLARSFGSATSRRGAIKGFLGGALAAVVGGAVAERAEAAGKENGETCVHDHHCASSVCCKGTCVSPCGPRRFLRRSDCACCKRTRSGDFTCQANH